MKPRIALLVFLLVVPAVAGAEKEKKSSPRLVEISSADQGDKKYLLKIVELERNAKTSKFKVTQQKRPSAVGGSMFVMRGFYEVAKARGTEYFTNLKEWAEKDGARIYIGGFTNQKNADIRAEFGKQFSPTNDAGQRRTFMSVSQCDLLWGKKE